ncbi:ubiquitin-like-conjugating enzyme ATG10 [Ischnura elegans]|uniref:ubiquitin-like-conjugating enzyme ATG10 n=1 Tax=Ischnura elegans TaxID=197161 RepID=UPI001ED880EE|nr:ubiquitin-like-conjugating enzyme ATG10 [Ischnura elegans]
MQDGEMEWNEFIALMEDFLDLSERTGDIWSLHGRKEEVGGAYLVRKVRQCGEPFSPNVHLDAYDLEESCMEDEEDSSSRASKDVHCNEASDQFWEHHVVYSASYRVPVIYFNAWRSSGELLSLEEIWHEVHRSFAEVGDSIGPDMWELVSQQEHPVLGKPFFVLHPCRTAKFLASLGSLSCGNLLVPWLSSLGPLVKLNLCPSYAREK